MADNRRKAKRKTAAQRRREARTAIIQRWDQIADDLWHLEQAIRRAPPGTFTDEERNDAIFELSQTCWDALANHRPRLPASEERRPSGTLRRNRLLIQMRNEVLLRKSDDELRQILVTKDPEALREFLQGQ